MPRVILWALSVIVFAAVPARLAETDASDIDFDQGVDASKALENAREKAGLVKTSRKLIPLAEIEELPPELARLGIPLDLMKDSPAPMKGPHGRACIDYPPEQDGGSAVLRCAQDEISQPCMGEVSVYDLLPKDLREAKISEKGSVTGPYEPLPRDSQLYAQAKAYPPRLGPLPPPIRDPLLEDWRQIDATRLELISQAQPLDVKDGQLYDQGVRINAWTKRIDARHALNKQEAAEYYASCPDAQPDNEYCKEWRRVYNACVVRGNASIEKHKTAVAVWKQDRQTLLGTGNAFRGKVKDWEDVKIEPFIEKAKGALGESCQKLVSVSASASPPTIAPRKTSTLTAEPKYASTPPDAKPCGTKYVWRPTITNLGNLSSPTSRIATFTSTGQKGTQDFRVEASDDYSTKVAGAVVAIEGGLRCLVKRSYDSGADTTTCVYSCPFHPVGPITLPGIAECPEIYDDQ